MGDYNKKILAVIDLKNLMLQKEIPTLVYKESICRLIRGSLSLSWDHQAVERQSA